MAGVGKFFQKPPVSSVDRGDMFAEVKDGIKAQEACELRKERLSVYSINKQCVTWKQDTSNVFEQYSMEKIRLIV